MAPPIEYTFLGYWWSMSMKIPGFLFHSWRIWFAFIGFVLFFVIIFNKPIGERWAEKWKGISPLWSVVVMGVLLIWSIMSAIYDRDREVIEAYKAAGDRAVKAEQQIAIAAPEIYLIGKDGSRMSNSGVNKYGLFVKREDKEEIIGGKKYIFPIYILRFKKSPSNIEITTQEGAVPTNKRIDANVFEVIFHPAETGFMGSGTVECNFKIQVY
jgi:hypothetical protein